MVQGRENFHWHTLGCQMWHAEGGLAADKALLCYGGGKACTAMWESLENQRASSFSHSSNALEISVCTTTCGQCHCLRSIRPLEAWIHHFCWLAKSQVQTNPALEGLINGRQLCCQHFHKEEVFLYVPFTAEVVHHAVNIMKLKKSAGSWYTDCWNSVCVVQHVSPSFSLGWNVRQGSILSPALFLLVMNPLLRQLQSPSIRATVNHMYAGAFLHSYDIRTLASNLSSLEAKVPAVKSSQRKTS